MTGASGRLWLTNDGHGRVELQSDAGDVQIVWAPQTISVYDASSNTVEWQSGGTSYVLAGSFPASAAETAARAVK